MSRQENDAHRNKVLVLTKNGFLTTRAESERKRAVRSVDTKPEVLLRRTLWRMGFRYRKHPRSLPGRPDIAFMRAKLAVFVDGDFWHGREWPTRKQRIKRNRDYWIRKIERNMERDLDVAAALHGIGWRVVRVWSSDVERDPQSCARDDASAIEDCLLDRSMPD